MSDCFRIRVASPRLCFSAGHFITFEHDDPLACEPLHGHDYRVTAELVGRAGPQHYVVDFTLIEALLAELIAPLDHRTLVPEQHDQLEITTTGDEYELRLGDRRWVLPRDNCTLLPVSNTTTEALARHLAERLDAALRARIGEVTGELSVEVHESPGYSAQFRLER